MRIRVRILAHICLDTTAGSRAGGSAEHTEKEKNIVPYASTVYVSSYYYICVLILLYTCPHTTAYVSSCSSILQAAVLAMAEDTQTKKTGADTKDQKRRGRGRTYTAVRNLLALLVQKCKY